MPWPIEDAVSPLRRRFLGWAIGVVLVPAPGCAKHRYFAPDSDLDAGAHQDARLPSSYPGITDPAAPDGQDGQGGADFVPPAPSELDSGSTGAELNPTVDVETSEAATDGSSPIQCGVDADCASPSASRCADNRCVPCQVNGDCSAQSGIGVCDLSTGTSAGICVQCTGAEAQACGGNVCDHLNRECEPAAPFGSKAICEPCVSDAHCVPNARCVQQTFGGMAVGFFCFPLQAAGACTRGFAGSFDGISTIEAQSASACLQRETTCPAFEAYREGRRCVDIDDDEACGIAGSCELSTAAFQCTISCAGINDCLSGSCVDGLCTL